MDGFLNVLKPSGISSAQVVNRLKKNVSKSKIGHMGTLDVGACGVLVVGVGKATRLFDFMLEKTKKYRAVFTFGIATETQDSYSGIVEQKPFAYSLERMQKALQSLTGRIKQMPPKYSAKHVDGCRAYDLARKGVDFTLQAKQVEVFDFCLVKQVEQNSFMFDITCSGGTYIRSLCVDLASALETVGYMSSLIRLSCGAFGIENSLLLEEIDVKKHLVSIESALKSLPVYEYESHLYDKLCNGVAVYAPSGLDTFVIKCRGELFGLSKVSEDGNVKVGVYLKNENTEF